MLIRKIKPLLVLTFPIFLGYVSVGFVFGVFARGAGLDFWYAVLVSILLYAGASQFLLVRLLQTAAPVFEIGIAIFLINLRHIFYYRPIQKKVPPKGPLRWYTISAMTDETFALLTDAEVTPKESFLVTMINQSYWVLGTVAGAYFGETLAKNIVGLEFSLIALFTVLLIEKLKWKQDSGLIAMSLGICIVSRVLVPSSLFLLASMSLCLFVLVLKERKSDH